MHRTLTSAAALTLALSSLATPVIAGVNKPAASGSRYAIILQNQGAGSATSKVRQLPPNPCKSKAACR
jgi:hypothetical protein